MKPSLLIALPTGLTIGGVQSWAVRLANGLAARGRAVGLILHPAVGTPFEAPLDPRVRMFNLDGVPSLDEAAGDLDPFIPHYARAIEEMAKGGKPVVCVPNLLGDCYGVFAALATEQTRLVGWCHSAIPYDARVLEYYEPALSRVVTVSDYLERSLRARLAARASDIVNIPCGVEVATAAGPRPEISNLKFQVSDFGPEAALIYLGRLDDDIKRVSCLPLLSDELARRGVRHRMTIVGDGPVKLPARPAITHIPSASPQQASRLLREHDIFVLPSRVEGLSLSMLEAMGAGCVPIVTRTESGAAQVITGANGVIVDPPSPSFDQLAVSLADAIQGVLPRLPAMSAGAHATIVERFSIGKHLDAVERLMTEAAKSPARPWPKSLPAAFTSSTIQGSGTVPSDAAARLSALLEELKGRRIAIHGTGRHTLELAPVLARFKDRIVAFTDDDPSRRSQTLEGLPILAPAEVHRTGVTDVVISSWINQDQIWDRRQVYEAQRIRVHRIYKSAA